MKRQIIRINASVDRSRTKIILQKLGEAGIKDIHVNSGRGPLLENPTGLIAILSGKETLTSHPVDCISFFVEDHEEESALDLLVSNGKLTIPGMGTAYSQKYTLNNKHPQCVLNNVKQSEKSPNRYYSNLVGIACIVQRGQGDSIARVVLESGSAVPTITYGTGTGVRDKLGLLRITIPAEKEVVTLITTSWDADDLVEDMIRTGRLDQPGKGFINTFDINKGILNTKVSSGGSKHAASMEQIIAAIDKSEGGLEWRKDANHGRHAGNQRHYFSGQDLNVICNDGTGVDLVKAAMDGGAAGATIEKISLREESNKSAQEGLSRAREICKLMVPTDKVEQIIGAMTKANAFGDKAKAMIFDAPVHKAFTYLQKSA